MTTADLLAQLHATSSKDDAAGLAKAIERTSREVATRAG